MPYEPILEDARFPLKKFHVILWMALLLTVGAATLSPAYAQTPTPTITNTPVPPCSGGMNISKNKFSPATDTQLIINFYLCAPGACSLKVYNTAGEHIATLWDTSAQALGAAAVTWYGKNDSQANVASGVYFISFKEPLGIHYGRVIVVK